MSIIRGIIGLREFDMEPTMSNHLSPENEQFLAAQVATGIFPSRDAAIEAGIELLRKHGQLVERVRESRRQLDAGEFNEYDEATLGNRFEKLRAKVGADSKQGE